jgi:phage replication O-like protein O
MPEPQLENGYLKIANELVEEFAKIQLSPNEWRVCWAFLRKTYGFNKKEDAISLTQFQQITKLSRPAIVKALKKLVAKQILVANKQLFTNHYSLNKDYSQWVSSYVDTSSRLATITSSYTDTTLVSKQQPKLVAKQIHTINNKDNIQKTILKTAHLTEQDLQDISDKYKIPIALVKLAKEEMDNWLAAKGKKYIDYKAGLRNWVLRNAKQSIEGRQNGRSRVSIDITKI